MELFYKQINIANDEKRLARHREDSRFAKQIAEDQSTMDTANRTEQVLEQDSTKLAYLQFYLHPKFSNFHLNATNYFLPLGIPIDMVSE